jgi:hypothetical protein
MENNKPTRVTKVTKEEVFDRILSSKDQYVKVAWKSNPKPSAKFKDTVLEKRTVAIVRSGIDYANLKEVKDDIEAEERPPVGPLPFGKWLAFPYLIEHNFIFYLRLTRSKSPIHLQLYESKYFVNDAEVSFDEFCSYLPASKAKVLAQPPEEQSPVFVIKLSNLLDID